MGGASRASDTATPGAGRFATWRRSSCGVCSASGSSAGCWRSGWSANYRTASSNLPWPDSCCSPREPGLTRRRRGRIRHPAAPLLDHRPVHGRVPDRWRRRQVPLVANLVRSVLVVGLIAATLGSWPVWATGLLVLFVLGLNRLILTALAASLPRTVSVDHLVPANAVAPVSGTVGAAVGGALAIGAGAMLGATWATTAALLAIAAVGLLVTAALEPADTDRSAWAGGRTAAGDGGRGRAPARRRCAGPAGRPSRLVVGLGRDGPPGRLRHRTAAGNRGLEERAQP